MSSDEIVIKVSNVSKCFDIYEKPLDRLCQFFSKKKKLYKEFWALKNISFTVHKGEAIGIIGRNGAGKSTLLQVITGILQPTRGEVYLKGRVAALLELGSGFNHEFTGRENVYLNAAILGFSREEIDKKIGEIIDFADIGDFIDQPVKTYSSGMMVRLAFSVQIMLDPDILIIDEALAVGDLLFQKKCYTRINELVSKGVTFVFVSHDVETMRSMTQRALLLNRGEQILFADSPTVLLEYRKLLHREEEKYFSDVLLKLQNPVSPVSSLKEQAVSDQSKLTSFGEEQVQIISTECFDARGNKTNVYYPGEIIKIRISCRSRIETNHLNISLRIRNKQGVKIYSWGTLNQDNTNDFKGHENLVWNKVIREGEVFSVLFQCVCNLGADIYEIQSCVSYEGKLDYSEQRILHWLDNACFFRVALNTNEYFFGGICDMRMQAILER